eukprot:TRINITY_DN58720_c0_g1_i1.p1 TRINITY_DN58720_c0_g1~~TRINITY_DN58720_c0_g1_i1.p1  ORF type:complete len:1107 (+),score=253.54 TRINITY_DN58720_c0_g1_i1:32-3352(+)
MAKLWEVLGADFCRDGLVVRSDCSLSSAAHKARLAVGSVVKELDFSEGRLHYVLEKGDGPEIGWVTIRLRGKDLVLKQEEITEEVRSKSQLKPREEVPLRVQEACDTGSSSDQEVKASSSEEMLSRDPKAGEEDEYAALAEYERKFGEVRDGNEDVYTRNSFPWCNPQIEEKVTPAEAVEAALALKSQNQKNRVPSISEVDSDGEDVPLCVRCFMPVGEFAYQGNLGGNKCMHAECMAQVMVEEAQDEESARVNNDTVKKLRSRKEYDIGWRMQSVPKNSAIAQRLGCSPVPKGHCCLVYDEISRTVQIAATHEPAAAVNLEYLLLALKVRRDGSREPLFSLDPIDATNLATTQQNKRYEPWWLAGTSVGDVMFQADYFLKELALGEYTMPVVGMMSVFDISEIEKKDTEWAGREWFVVKKAEIRLAADKTLVPHVKMGVEAREQEVNGAQLEDKPVTNPNHPLKKFADAFTRNFDLIAERKSVVYHLRELAKASVMAKFLVDSKVLLDPSWYEAANDIVKSAKAEKHPNIPQLWNMRGNSRIQVQDGRLVNTATGKSRNLRAVYGGVQFGLDKFELSSRQLGQGQQRPAPAAQVGAGVPGLGRLTQLAAPGARGAPLDGRQPLFVPERFQIGQRSMAPSGQAAPSVQFGLDKFELAQRSVMPPTAPMRAPQQTTGLQIGPGARGAPLEPSSKLFVPERFQIAQRDLQAPTGPGRGTPQGVDLNLDQFALTEPDSFACSLTPCSAPLDSPAGRVMLGRVFLEKLRAGTLQSLKEEDKAFLKAMFNPVMCDRIEEGAAFTPPDPDHRYIAKVRNLVHEEGFILQRRKLRFFDKSFIAGNAGPEFPAAWTSNFQIEKDGKAKQQTAADREGLVQIQVDSIFQQTLRKDILPLAASEFQRSTEDGVMFRIYRIGSLEIRTTQDPDGEETVGAVFSRRAPEWLLRSGNKAKQAREDEAIVKAKVYIEASETEDARTMAAVSCEGKPFYHFFVVLETDATNAIVTEQLRDGSIGWAVNPSNLEDRNSLAKLLFSVEADGKATVRAAKTLQAMKSSKVYAKALLKLIADYNFQGKWGGKAHQGALPVPSELDSEARKSRRARQPRAARADAA